MLRSRDGASAAQTHSFLRLGGSPRTGIRARIYYNLGDQDGDIDYDWPYGRCMYSKGSGNRTFELTNFLSDLKSTSSVLVNCSDCGNLVNIFTAAVGVSSQSKRIGNPAGFDTKSINPIGTPGWAATSWGYHQYGWISSKVFDGCIEVNHNSPILPTNMSQNIYDNHLTVKSNTYSKVIFLQLRVLGIQHCFEYLTSKYLEGLTERIIFGMILEPGRLSPGRFLFVNHQRWLLWRLKMTQ